MSYLGIDQKHKYFKSSLNDYVHVFIDLAKYYKARKIYIPVYQSSIHNSLVLSYMYEESSLHSNYEMYFIKNSNGTIELVRNNHQTDLFVEDIVDEYYCDSTKEKIVRVDLGVYELQSTLISNSSTKYIFVLQYQSTPIIEEPTEGTYYLSEIDYLDGTSMVLELNDYDKSIIEEICFNYGQQSETIEIDRQIQNNDEIITYYIKHPNNNYTRKKIIITKTTTTYQIQVVAAHNQTIENITISKIGSILQVSDAIRNKTISISETTNNFYYINKYGTQETITYDSFEKTTVVDEFSKTYYYYFKNNRFVECTHEKLINYNLVNNYNLVEIDATIYNNISRNGTSLSGYYYVNEAVYTDLYQSSIYPEEQYQDKPRIIIQDTYQKIAKKINKKGHYSSPISAIIKLYVTSISFTKAKLSIDFYDSSNNKLESYVEEKTTDTIILNRWNSIVFTNICKSEYDYVVFNLEFVNGNCQGTIFIDMFERALATMYIYKRDILLNRIINDTNSFASYGDNLELSSDKSGEYLYDNKSRLIEEEKEFNVVTNNEYNLSGYMVETKVKEDLFEIKKSYSYDSYGQVLTETENIYETTTDYSYTNYGNLFTSKIHPSNDNTIYFRTYYSYSYEITNSYMFNTNQATTYNILNNQTINSNQLLTTITNEKKNNSGTTLETNESYTFTYNTNRLVTNVKRFGTDLLTCYYNENRLVSRKDYLNGYYSFSYNTHLNVSTIKYNNVTKYTFEYDTYNPNLLLKVYNKYISSSAYVSYEYDINEQIKKENVYYGTTDYLYILTNSDEKTANRKTIIRYKTDERFYQENNNSRQIINKYDFLDYLRDIRNTYATFMCELDDKRINLINKRDNIVKKIEGTISTSNDKIYRSHTANYVDYISSIYPNTYLSYSFNSSQTHTNHSTNLLFKTIDNYDYKVLFSFYFDSSIVLTIIQDGAGLIYTITGTSGSTLIKSNIFNDSYFHLLTIRITNNSIIFLIDGEEQTTTSIPSNVYLNSYNIYVDKLYLSSVVFAYLDYDDSNFSQYLKNNIHKIIYYKYLEYSNQIKALKDTSLGFTPYVTISNHHKVANDADLISFHNSLTSINGLEPDYYFVNKYDSLRSNFAYDKTIEQSVFYHHCQTIQYFIPIGEEDELAKTITFRFKPLKLEEKTIFKIGSYEIYLVFSNNSYRLYLKYSQTTQNLYTTIALNTWYTFTIVYERYLEINNRIKHVIKLYCGTTYLFELSSRNARGFADVVAFTINQDYLNAYYESLYFDNVFRSQNALTTLYNKVFNYNKLVTKSNTFGLAIERKIINSNQDILLKDEYQYELAQNELQQYYKKSKIESIVKYFRNGSNTLTSNTYQYEYDYLGNITKIKIDNTTLSQYGYDTFGRLISETNYNNYSPNASYVYDIDGNITSKTINNNTITYSYDTTYPKRLNSCGTTSLTYSSSNPYYPTSITKNNVTYTISYEGRKISQIVTPSQTIIFKYNEQGLRVYKDVRSNDTDFFETSYYYYDANNNLVMETRENMFTKFQTYYLRENGILYGLIFEGMLYYYVRDINGLITGIANDSGQIVVRYYYDAYGKIYHVSDSTQEALGTSFNPYRYHDDYYYDKETNLYYLKSRYYDPEISRFLTPDDISYLDSSYHNGLNLYCYCNNNPIMFVDPEGHSISIALLIVLGAILLDTIIETSILMNSDKYSAESVYSNGNVKIPNSALFNNPIAQFIYSNYLYYNVKDENGNNFFNGGPYDIMGEWMAHNFAFYFISQNKQNIPLSNDLINSYLRRAYEVDLGKNISSNSNPIVRKVSIIFKLIIMIITSQI